MILPNNVSCHLHRRGVRPQIFEIVTVLKTKEKNILLLNFLKKNQENGFFYPEFGLDHLNGICDDGGHQTGHDSDEEGLAGVQAALDTPHLQNFPLEVLVDGELDGGVADQDQRGHGPTPEAEDPLMPGFLDQAV